MPVPFAFANATTSLPLSQLDANFNTPITLGNTAIQLGNTVTTLNNMTLANVTITSGTSNIASSGNITIGNTTIALGNSTSSLGNVTLANTTVTNYTETLFSATGNTTINLTNGTIQKITTSGATTITLPSSVAGKSFSVLVAYAAADTLTWAGGSTLKWSQGATPTPTSATGKFDLFSFVQDGTNTYGIVNGQNY
jgi:hypothetical protein